MHDGALPQSYISLLEIIRQFSIEFSQCLQIHIQDIQELQTHGYDLSSSGKFLYLFANASSPYEIYSESMRFEATIVAQNF